MRDEESRCNMREIVRQAWVVGIDRRLRSAQTEQSSGKENPAQRFGNVWYAPAKHNRGYGSQREKLKLHQAVYPDAGIERCALAQKQVKSQVRRAHQQRSYPQQAPGVQILHQPWPQQVKLLLQGYAPQGERGILGDSRDLRCTSW